MWSVYPTIARTILVLGLFLSTSCKPPTSPNETPDNSKFTLGSKSAVATQAISSSGGTLTVSGSQTKLDGLMLTVPDTAYAGAKTFVVSYTPITGTKLSSDVVALTPMITIENGGGYASSPMTVQIPITLPTGSFAGAFFYNESTGELEPIPVDAETSTLITISTCHFSTSTLTGSSHFGKGSHTPSALSYSDIVILAMDENKLFAVGNQVTGFTPGVDDWEFTNYGSYLAPGGHCAGQSLTAMWYYDQEKSVENHALNGYLSTNPNFTTYPSANRLGYRFASMVQRDQDFAHWFQHVTFQSWNPPLTFKLFLLGIYVSKQPQYLNMYRSADTGGHAMVCYGVQYTDKSNGKLLIADPNHPGQPTEIDFVNGQFQPYETGLRADGAVLAFDRFSVLAKTAYIPWDQIGTRWGQVKAKTIGNVGPHAFPQVSMTYYDPDVSAWVNMPTTFTINSDSLAIDWAIVPNSTSSVVAYATDGTGLHWKNNKLVLQYGKNIIGFFIKAVPPDDTNKNWVDFIWDTIYSNQLAIDPKTMTGQPGTSYIWSASAGTIPNNARYEWDFGDGTSLVVKNNDGAASHIYAQSGFFTITLSLYDNATNQLLGKTTATATIGGFWTWLHQQTGVKLSLQSAFNYSDGSQSLLSWDFPEDTLSIPITWKDTAFTGILMRLSYGGNLYYDSEICVVHGTLLSDGVTIKSLTLYRRKMYVTYDSSGGVYSSDERITSYTASNAVGIAYPGQLYPLFAWANTDVSNIISNVSDQETTFTNTTPPTRAVKTLTSVSWGSNVQNDLFNIQFP